MSGCYKKNDMPKMRIVLDTVNWLISYLELKQGTGITRIPL